MKKGLIYCLICPLSKKPKYVGQTIRPLSKRLKEHKYKIEESNSHKNNKPHTQETKDKISKSKKGTVPHNIKKIKQYSIDGRFIKEWESSTKAGKELKMSQGNISMVANNKRKSAGGFIWKWSK